MELHRNVFLLEGEKKKYITKGLVLRCGDLFREWEAQRFPFPIIISKEKSTNYWNMPNRPPSPSPWRTNNWQSCIWSQTVGRFDL
jgi:hypothetical protein